MPRSIRSRKKQSDRPVVAGEHLEARVLLSAAPIIDLDVDDSEGTTGGNYSALFSEGGGPVSLCDTDAVISDADSTHLTSMVVTISNYLNLGNEIVLADVDGTSISSSFNSGTGVLTLSGVDTIEQYQQVLRSLTYNNTANPPNATSRSILIEGFDGENSSNIAQSTVGIELTNRSPSISSPYAIATAGGEEYTFSSGNDHRIEVSDPDVGSGLMLLGMEAGNGILTLSQTTGLTFLSGTGSGESWLLFRGTPEDINQALEGMIYTPSNGFRGVDSLDIEVDDLGNTGLGGARTAQSRVLLEVGGETFLQGDYLEIGLNELGTLVSHLPAPEGFHNGEEELLGAISNPGRDGWATHDGDFILPGSPLDEWGINLGGTTYTNSNSDEEFLYEIEGRTSAMVDDGSTQTVVWTGGIEGLEIVQHYSVSRNDLYMTVTVTLTNTTEGDLTDLYFYRHADPDNNNFVNEEYSTQNRIVSQGNDALHQAYVTARQEDGSEMGFMGFGENARAAFGNFGEIDPIDAYEGEDGNHISGEEFEDNGITMTFKIDTLPSGESVTLNMRYYFDDDTSGPADTAPTFKNGEGIILLHPDGDDVSVEDTVVRPDGRVVVLGGIDEDGFYLSQVLPDGTLDEEFGIGGRVLTDFWRTSESPSAIALQPDGKLIAIGNAYSPDSGSLHGLVARYLPDGSLDQSFGYFGYVPLYLEGFYAISDVAVQLDGRIVIVGEFATPDGGDFGVLRLLSDGSYDSDFGEGGITGMDFSLTGEWATSVAIQEDQKIVVAGGARGEFSDTDFALARFGSDGTLDEDFGFFGTVQKDFGTTEDYAKTLLIHSDGDILVGGSIDWGGGGYFALTRLDSSGNLDPNWGDFMGLADVSLPDGYAEVKSLVELSDGSVLAVGDVWTSWTEPIVVAVRLDEDGEMYEDFADEGRLIVPAESGIHNFGGYVTVDAFGEIVIGGTSQNLMGESRPFLAKYSEEGILSKRFGSDFDTLEDRLSYDGIVALSHDNAETERMVRDADGNLIVAGDNDDQIDILRFHSDGSLDTTFGIAGSVLIGDGEELIGFSEIAVLDDGKILIVGDILDESFVSNLLLIRLNSDGSYDETFGEGGRLVVSNFTGSEWIEGLKVLSDGDFLLFGGGENGEEVSLYVARFNADGSLDADFGDEGMTLVSVSGNNVYGIDFDILDDGRILVLGYDYDINWNPVYFMSLISAEGELDTEYGESGLLELDFTSGVWLSDLVVQEDGKILLGGQFYSGTPTGTDLFLSRIDLDGSRDVAFGVSGETSVDFDLTGDWLEGITVLEDGSILVVGGGWIVDTRDFLLTVKFDSSGSLDPNFGENGFFVQDFETVDCWGDALVVDESGNIVIGGGIDVSDLEEQILLVGLYADGTLSEDFGGEAVPVYVEGEIPVVIDWNVEVYDAELSRFGDYGGATLSIERVGELDSDDHFVGVGRLGELETEEPLTLGGVEIGTVVANEGGRLQLLFGAGTSEEQVNAVLRSIAYYSTDDTPPEYVDLMWLFHDGNTGEQGSGTGLAAEAVTRIEIVSDNDEPEINIPEAFYDTHMNQTFVFSETNGTLISIEDPDAGDDSLEFTLSVIGGTIALGDSGDVTIFDGADGTNGIAFSGSVAGINTALAGMVFTPDEDFEGTATIRLIVDDLGNSGEGGNRYAERTIGLSVRNTGVSFTSEAPNILTESGTSNTFYVVLTAQPTSDVILDFVTEDDVSAEVQISATQLVFTPDNWDIPQGVTLTGLDDEYDDGDYSFWFVTEVHSDDLLYDEIETANQYVEIQDDDTKGIVITAPDQLVTSEAGETFQLDVVLASRPRFDVLVMIYTTDSSVGTVSTDSLYFTSANWNVPQTVSVAGVDDSVDDGDTEFFIEFYADSDDDDYGYGYVQSLAVMNEENDTSGITVSSDGPITTSESPNSATLSIVLNSQPKADVVILIQSLDPTEGYPSADLTVFDASNWNVPQEITIYGIDDVLDDGNVFYYLNFTAVSEDGNYDLGTFHQELIENIDNDSPPDALDDTVATDEDQAIRVAVADNDSAYGAALALDSIRIETWPVHGSTRIDPDTFEIIYTPDADYYGSDSIVYRIFDEFGRSDTATVNITVNQVQGAAPGITVNELTALGTTEGGASATLEFVLNSEPTAPVVIQLQSDNTFEGRPVTAILVFTSTNWNVPRSVAVQGVDDNFDDGDVGYTIVFSSLSDDPNYNIGPFGAKSFINDDDDSPPVAVNDAASTNEETTARFNVSNNDSAPNSTLSLDSIQIVVGPSHGSAWFDVNTHEIVYTPNSNYSGSDTLTYRIANAIGLTDQANVLITVNSTNDAPVITVPNTLPRVFIRSGTPVSVFPEVSITDTEGNLAGGTLKLAFDWAVAKTGIPYDTLVLPTVPNISDTPFEPFATAWSRVDGHRELTLTLNSNATPENIAAFLDGVTFSTTSKGIKVQSRTLQVTLTDAGNDSALLTQQINVRTTATTSHKPPKSGRSLLPSGDSVPMARLSYSIGPDDFSLSFPGVANFTLQAPTNDLTPTTARISHDRTTVRRRPLKAREVLPLNDGLNSSLYHPGLVDSLFSSTLML